MSGIQNKKIDNFSFATLWCVTGFVVMGIISIAIDAKTHSNIEYCLTPICKVWVQGIDSSSCEKITEQLNKTKDNTLDSFYMCR